MLNPSCNVVSDKIQSFTQCSFWGSPKILPNLNRRRNVSFPCSKRPDPSVSVSTTTNNGLTQTENGSGSIGLADRLRLGSLTEDGLSYKENFIVRSYEVGINKTATVETIANLLQEVGCNHAQSVGFSTDGFATTPTMRKLHLIWVTARMHIEIYRYPAWSDVVEIETWCQAEGKIGTRRDFILKDYANGEVIGRATSKWVMMNMDTRRLERVTPQIGKEYLIYCPKELRLAFPEPNNNSLKKISKLEDPAQYSKQGLVPRRGDLDMNHHVNNVTYIGWTLESTPEELVDTHELRSITLDYRRECQRNDVVDSLTSVEPIKLNESILQNGANGSPTSTRDENDSVQFLHLLRLSADGSEINRGRTEWRRKPERQ
ncbi:oleoyl-acyl carrier protein thioesterase 1, chloroplastic-like [Chenopodium quinoa]|uniref:Acyl-[acyl-carrier-protein] hydrolase n=1 Tax=Chenopodium quinoa TaxID=63459 RepID=A0A803KQ24_CHEQI|nr:oleoyl-acyl carrier protein thioesterase 1, chloroplastic-like [Chenopodium quinoa]